MTAYVVLAKLPLSPGENGPCLVVNAGDVSAYRSMRQSNQSSVAVAAGERLCEADLLKGLLVHSASNYAAMLANLTWGTQSAFIAQMNAVASALHMVSTHYSDVSGYRPTNVSTASDQGRLAALLMANPVFAADVKNASVVLPVAGRVSSYTPYIGRFGVIGVKSGRTDAAGGCDVMATMMTYEGQPTLVIVVVLGQRGGDLLGPAGLAALALSQSVTPESISAVVPRGTVVGHLSWAGSETNLLVRRGLQLRPSWVPLGNDPASYGYLVSLQHFTKRLRAHQVVGRLTVRSGEATYARSVVVRRAIGPATLWQDLR
jgi:D-alanyl-D-alanine carboxypeptidase (penicillin-binding protein 5/6)